jgi:type I restriction enzyme S subunit
MTMATPDLEEATLADVCSLVTDGTHDTPKRVSTGYPLVKAKEIVGGRIDFESCDQISEKEHLDVVARSKPELGDTLFAHIGASLGEAAYVNTRREFSIKNIALFKPNPAVVDGRYLYYVVVSPQFQALAKGTKTGSAQPFLSLHQLRSHRIQYHKDLPVQRRVAGILSAYDDLIENNRQRIRILEDMARTVYREWFVEFRAPGVELRRASANEAALTGRTVFPVEWAVRPMEEVADVVDCLHSKKPAEDTKGSGMLLQLFNIDDGGKLNVAKRYLISDADYQEWTSRIEVRAGDCIVTNVGRVGAIAQIPEGVSAALGRNMTAVRPRPGVISAPYLLEYLLSSYMSTETARKKDMGTIMDALNVKGIVRLGVPVPSTGVLDSFSMIVGPIHHRIQLCVRQNLNLRSTRDLLLQRLMSGEVSVSDGEIGAADRSMRQVGAVSQ